ncbi:hypothetical protein TCAL_09772 [Tigriopus californicus]|uniref:Uncharacterized protein n=1 Tax=Tigriopus californicus TaxID=6832 RepID=A0A553PLI2_TIGCA|nr:hypothetical protein TCAL_09772 [Tigriopus californicus]
MSIAVNQLDTSLFGQGQLDTLTIGLTQSSDALLKRLDGILDLRLHHTLLLGHDLANDLRDGHWLVHARLHGLGVSNTHGHINGSDNWHVVLGLLSDLLAILMAISLVAVSIAGLANGHHLDVALFGEGYIDSLANGILVLLLTHPQLCSCVWAAHSRTEAAGKRAEVGIRMEAEDSWAQHSLHNVGVGEDVPSICHQQIVIVPEQ